MADNFFVSTLKFSLTDDISVHLGKISYNFDSLFDKLSKSEKAFSTVGLIAGKKLISQTKESIKDYAELEQDIVSLGIALDVTNEEASSLVSSFSILKNSIPLEDIRKFVIELASASNKGKELSKNSQFIESILKVSQAKGLGLDKLLDFSVALSKAYGNLSPDEMTGIITDLATLSTKAVEGISSVTTKGLQELNHYKVDIQKLIPLLGTLQEFTTSAGSGLETILSVFGDLQGDKGALAYAALGIQGDRNFTEEYSKIRKDYPEGIVPQEIADMLSKNWKDGMRKLIEREGGDIFKAVTVLFKNLKKIQKETSNTYLIDTLGQEKIAILNILSSKDVQDYYKDAIEKKKDSEKILEEQFNRRQETLNATFSDTGKLITQLSEQFGEFASKLLYVKEVFSEVNDFLRNFVKEEEKEKKYVPKVAQYINPLGASTIAAEYLSDKFGKEIDDLSEKGRNLLGIENVFDLKNMQFIPRQSKQPGIDDTKNNSSIPSTNKSEGTIPAGTFNYSPIINISTDNQSLKNDVSALLDSDKQEFYTQSKRLIWG